MKRQPIPEGRDTSDVKAALFEVDRAYHQGCKSGHDSNDGGAYHFNEEEIRRKKLAW